MPMCGATGGGKGGRYHDQLRPIGGQLAIKMRKAHIIADAQSHLHSINWGDHRRGTSGKAVRFAIALTITDIGVKHVNFVIMGRDRPVRGDQ